MQQSSENNHVIQIISSNESICQPIRQYFPIFPYQLYHPMWPFPFPAPNPSELNRQMLVKCQSCRSVSCCSVMIQTQEKQQQRCGQQNKSQQRQKDTLPSLKSFKEDAVKIEEEISQIANIKEAAFNDISVKCQPLQNSNQINQNQSQQINKKFKQKQELFVNMLQLFMTSPSQYQKLIKQNTNSGTLLSVLVNFFNDKLYNFKKSKQQMIKLIIRKTQRHYKLQNNCKKDDRFKKFGGFKSMNSVYLQKLFSDQAFVSSYNFVIQTFIDDFNKESMEKLSVFVQKIYSAENQTQFKVAMRTLDQKNKMPWPVFWVAKLKKVIFQLKTTYINNNKFQDSHNKKKVKQQSS